MNVSAHTLLHKPKREKTFTFKTETTTQTFTIIKRIDQSNAVVDLCLDENEKYVAIKTHRIEMGGEGNSETRCLLIMNGIDLIQQNESDYVVKIKGYFYHPKSEETQLVYLIMEYFEHGNLFKYINSIEEPVPEKMVTMILSQLAQALHTFHSKKIIHRDIKPANILIAEMTDRTITRIAITDFDLVRETEGESSNFSTMCGTRGYKSPEVMGKNKYGARGDIWALGVVAIELMLGAMNNYDIAIHMLLSSETDIHNEIKKKLEERGYTNKVISRVLQMISLEKEKRGTAYDVHQWCTVYARHPNNDRILLQNPREGDTFRFVTLPHTKIVTKVKLISSTPYSTVELCHRPDGERRECVVKTVSFKKSGENDPFHYDGTILTGIDCFVSYTATILDSYYYVSSDEVYHIYTVMEYYKHGDLMAYMKNCALPQVEVVTVLSQVSHALRGIHSKRAVHRGVKPSNILIASIIDDTIETVALTDFDLVKRCSSLNCDAMGTRRYLSPEVISTNEYSTSSDIWALGITIIELMLGEPSRVNFGCTLSQQELEATIHSEIKLQLEQSGNYAHELISHVLNMIRFSPKDRVTARESFYWCRCFITKKKHKRATVFGSGVTALVGKAVEFREEKEHFYFVTGEESNSYRVVKQIEANSDATAAYLCQSSNNEYFAISKYEYYDQYMRDLGMEAIELVCSLHAENIVKVLECYYHDGITFSVWTVTKYFERALPIYISYQIVPESTVRLIMNQLSTALCALHRHNIMHRNISPYNILITRMADNEITGVELDGLSLARKTGNTGTYTKVGALRYMSPEMWQGKYGLQSDMWSLGLVLIDIMLGGSNHRVSQILQRMRNRDQEAEVHREVKYKLKARKVYSAELIDWVVRMISYSPNNRGTADDLSNLSSSLEDLYRVYVNDDIDQIFSSEDFLNSEPLPMCDALTTYDLSFLTPLSWQLGRR